MKAGSAIDALGALAQEHRLALFRLLVQAGEKGMAAGAIAEALGVPNSSLSFHLAQLRNAGLILQERQHRSLIYRANSTLFGAGPEVYGRLKAADRPVLEEGRTTCCWFTSSTSFANPAITVARSLSDTFAGIAPREVSAFVVAQLAGAAVAALFARDLFDRS